MKKNLSPRNGFTLIELLVVIAILGILAAIGLASFLGTQEKARDAKRKSDLDNIARALELYYNDYNEYPAGESDGRIRGCGTSGAASPCSWGGPMNRGGYDYMLELPEDFSGNKYFYRKTNGNGYQIYTLLENLDDGKIIVPTNTGAHTDPMCGAEVCNYGIASPDERP